MSTRRKGPNRPPRHRNEYETSVLVSTEHQKQAEFDILQYEVERFATWFYVRYAKVYLLKPEVEVVTILHGTAFKLTFRWHRWEI